MGHFKNVTVNQFTSCGIFSYTRSGFFFCQDLKGCYISRRSRWGESGSCVFHPTNTTSGAVPRDGEHAVLSLGSLKSRYGTHLVYWGWKAGTQPSFTENTELAEPPYVVSV